MGARPASVPPRSQSSSSSSKPTALLTLRSAIILIATALLSTTATAESSSFELQTNLVSCGGDSSANTNAGGSTAPVAVCAPPESKLFNNVRVVNGTPRPGSTGVRGRLYDVGTLCTEKVSEKIDRAWIAFLDCGGGCPLATKLANLQGSNPQAVLIYNQAACTVNTPSTQPAAPVGGSTVPAAPTLVASPVPTPAAPPETDAPVTSVAPAAPTLEAPPAAATTTAVAAPAPAAPTQPADSSPNGGDKGDEGEGDSNDDVDGDRNDDDDDRNDNGEGDGENDDEDNGDNDDSNDGDDNNDDGDDDDENEETRKHPRSFRTRSMSSRNSNIISLEGLVGAPGEGQGKVETLPQGRSPRPRPIPHPHVVGSEKRSDGKSSPIDTQGRSRSPRPRPAPRPIVGPASVIAEARDGISGDIEPQGRSPRPRPVPHPHIIVARRAAPASSSDNHLHHQQQYHEIVKAMDIADAYVQFPITVAMAEQVTTDYLLKVLTGPASFSPLPAPLKALKTTVNPNGAASVSSSINPTAAADSNNGVITDLMVSISPAFGEPTGERKFLSMSKPIFATVIGILSVVVCGVVLMYVIRPLVKRHRKQSGGRSTALVDDNDSESRGTPPSQSTGSGAAGYYGNSTAYSSNNSNGGSGFYDGGYDDHTRHSSKEGPYSASSTATGPASQPPPMQEVFSEKHSYQKRDSNSAPTIFDHSLSGNNIPHSATVFPSASILNAVEPEDPEYAQKHLELLRNQDQYREPQTVPLPASTVATPTTATAPTPSAQMKEIQSTRTRSNWGSGYTPTTPSVYSISTPTSTTATVASATPTTTEPSSGSTSAFENIRAAGSLSHNRVNNSVGVIPEESHHSFLEPAAPQDYTDPTSTSGLTPATSGSHHHENENEDEEDDRYSVVSSRNGSDLFHSESKPRLFPTSIDTSGILSSSSTGNIASASSSITREGGLATTLYRNHRLSMDNPGGFSSPAAQSPFSNVSLNLRPRGSFGTGADSNSNTPRASATNDFLPSRVSMDSPASYRNSSRSIDLQTRYQDLMSSSRASGAPRSSVDGGTPRASFSDDYRHRVPTTPSSSRLANTTTTTGEATPRASISNDVPPRASFSEDYHARPSLDTLRANMNASSTPTSATASSELMSPLREQRASTASWSRYARRDPSGATAN
ncbi:hypothetical protein BGZ89_008970 [Linnemannia elongata]|nr:hypothetical protein BGZ89_008970 [Linnemannia elongata]